MIKRRRTMTLAALLATGLWLRPATAQEGHDAAATPATGAAHPGAAAEAQPAPAAEGEPVHDAVPSPAGEHATSGHEIADGEPAAAGHEATTAGHGEPAGGAVGHGGAGHDSGAEHDICHHGGDQLDVLAHLANGPCLEVPFLPFLGVIRLPAGLSKVTVWMMISAVFLILLFAFARRGMGLVPKGLYSVLEQLVLFVRDEIAIKNMGDHHGREYTPYLLTVFFFILTCNLLGLVPGGVTVTGNINITAALAILTLAMMQIGGMKQYGVVGHFKNLVPHGIPMWLLPLMIIVEIMGVLAKPFALAVRLFANMTAGHVIILSLLGLIFSMSVWMFPVSIGFSIFIFLLELMVAFLQAYIFTMLTSLFIGMTVHVSH